MRRIFSSEEMDEGPAVPIINPFIDAELARLPAVTGSTLEWRGRLREIDAFLHEVRSEM